MESSVRSGLGWVGLANSLSKGSTYLCANFYPQCCPTVQVGCCGSGHQVCIPGGEEEGLFSYLGQFSLKSFLEGNVSNDFLFHSIKPPLERLLLNHTNTPGFLAPGGEEFNPGPETRLDRSELCVIKFY